MMRATLGGPHRDDCALTVAGRAAREFASEGQQRSLAIALRLAEAAFLRARTGVTPVLLADDMLGELDAGRRRRFWGALDEEHQVIATGTREPDSAEAPAAGWEVFEVRGGCFSAKGAA
jgi:DNA replication and repair protein RecF